MAGGAQSQLEEETLCQCLRLRPGQAGCAAVQLCLASPTPEEPLPPFASLVAYKALDRDDLLDSRCCPGAGGLLSPLGHGYLIALLSE